MGGNRGRGKRKAAEEKAPPKALGKQGRGGRSPGGVKAPRLTAASLASHAMASAGVASGSDSLHGVTKGICYNCKVKRSEKGPFLAQVDFACCACLGPYPTAFSHHGTFIEFVDKKSRDEELQSQCEQALRVMGKKAPCWQATAVEDADEVTVKHSVSLIGPSRADLLALMDGTTPEELGVKLETLEHPDGSSYKGLLMPDPQCPRPRYEISVTKAAKKRQTRMEPASQIFAGQADQAMSFARKEKIEQPNFNNMLLTKMRTMPWTLKALAEKAQGHRVKQGKPGLIKMFAVLGNQPGSSQAGVAPAAADDEHTKAPEEASDEEEEQEEGEEEDPEVDVVVPVSTGVMLNSNAVAESMSVAGTRAGVKRKATGLAMSETSGKTVSPGAKVGRVKMDSNGLPMHDGDKKELVDRWIASADIGKILAGVALGREVRWCRDSRDLFRTANENKYADMLQLHYELCKQAELLAESAIGKLEEGELKAAVKELQGAGHALPESMQCQLYQRRLAELLSDLRLGTVDDLMSLIVPWTLTVGGDQTPESFDGLCPKLAYMSGTVDEKGNIFCNAFSDALVRLIKGDAKEEETLLNVVDRAQKYLAAHSEAEAAEAYDSYVDQALLMVRAIKTIGDATCTAYFPSIVNLEQSCGKKQKSKNPAVNSLYLALKSSVFWWRMFVEHKEKGESSQKHLEEIQRYNGLFQDTDNFMKSGQFLEMLKALPAIYAECRPALYGSLADSAEKTLLEYVNKLAQADGFDLSSPSCPDELASARVLLQVATAALPKQMSTWSAGLQRLLTLESSLNQLQAAAGFRELAARATEQSWGDEAKRSELLTATKRLAQTEAGASAVTSEVLGALSKSAIGFVMSSCDSGSEAGRVLEIVGAMAASPSFPKLSEADAVALSMARAWRPLELASEEFNALGNDLPARIAAASSKMILTKLASVCAQAGEDAECLNNFKGLSKEVNKTQEVLDAAFGKMVDVAGKAVKDSRKNIEPVAKGGKKGEVWTDGVAESKKMDIAAVVAVAKNTILKIKGTDFEGLLTRFRGDIDYMKEVHELFGKEWAGEEQGNYEELYRRAMVTKLSGLLLNEYVKDQSDPNPSKLRRAVKALRRKCDKYSDAIQPGVWQWSASAENF